MTENTASTGASTDVEIPVARLDEDRLRSVATVSDAEAVLSDLGFIIPEEPEYGSGFEMLDDKDRLLKVGFTILEWRFVKSSDFVDNDGNPGEYVAAQVVTALGEKYIITDGSTGIYKQLVTVTENRLKAQRPNVHPRAGLRIPRGLRKSEYGINRKTGEIGKVGDPGMDKAATYYLA